MTRPLENKVALVTGASRGAGRAIACVLGEAGATVWITGRSVRGGATIDGRTETIDDTKELIEARGGRAIAVRCDHASEEDVRALAARIDALDILVNNAWGGYEGHDETFVARFWNQPFQKRWSGMFEAGLRGQMLAAHQLIPKMLGRPGGLILSTVAWDRGTYLGNTFYDVTKSAQVRFMSDLAFELRSRRIACVTLAPGFMRTERVLDAVGDLPEELKISESPEYSARGVVALATDPALMEKSGRVFRAGELARIYGYTDVDGRQPPPFGIKWEKCGVCGETVSADCRACFGLGEIAKESFE